MLTLYLPYFSLQHGARYFVQSLTVTSGGTTLLSFVTGDGLGGNALQRIITAGPRANVEITVVGSFDLDVVTTLGDIAEQLRFENVRNPFNIMSVSCAP